MVKRQRNAYQNLCGALLYPLMLLLGAAKARIFKSVIPRELQLLLGTYGHSSGSLQKKALLTLT